MEKTNQTRGRPEKLTEELRQRIDRLKGQPGKWTGVAIHKTLVKEAREKLRNENPKLSDEAVAETIKELLPSLSRIQKYLKRPSGETPKLKLDAVWCLGTLPDYPLPAEAIRYIILAQDYAASYPHPIFKTPQEPVTIHQAQWIGRLYIFYPNLKPDKRKENLKVGQRLYDWSKAYAIEEAVCKSSRTNFDSSVFDAGFREDAFPILAGSQWILHHRDGSLTVDSRTEKQIKTKAGEIK